MKTQKKTQKTPCQKKCQKKTPMKTARKGSTLRTQYISPWDCLQITTSGSFTLPTVSDVDVMVRNIPYWLSVKSSWLDISYEQANIQTCWLNNMFASHKLVVKSRGRYFPAWWSISHSYSHSWHHYSFLYYL